MCKKIIIICFMMLSSLVLHGQKVGLSYVKTNFNYLFVQGVEIAIVDKNIFASINYLHGRLKINKKNEHSFAVKFGYEFETKTKNISFIPYTVISFKSNTKRLEYGLGITILLRVTDSILISYDHRNITQSFGIMYQFKNKLE